MWGGWTDEEEEGSFIDPNTKEVLNLTNGFQRFRIGEPNGMEAENCVVQWAIDAHWVDYPCNDKSIGSCFLERMPPQFQLRGCIVSHCKLLDGILATLLFQAFRLTYHLMKSIQ